jgi:hypothetical protein
MLKLLLRSDRHNIKREYNLRIFVLFLMSLIIISILFAIFLVAPYSEITIEKQITQDQYKVISNSSDTKDRKEFTELSKRVKEKNSYISEKNIKQSELLKEVVDVPHTGVGLSGMSFQISALLEEDKEIGRIAMIELRGISDARDNLVDFQKSLLEKDLFASVDIPFSNFAKSFDIPFTVNIKTVELNNYLENKNE